MSTKTIYKRIALVAVAALGAGVLSVAPASAAAAATTLTFTNTTSATTTPVVGSAVQLPISVALSGTADTAATGTLQATITTKPTNTALTTFSTSVTNTAHAAALTTAKVTAVAPTAATASAGAILNLASAADAAEVAASAAGVFSFTPDVAGYYEITFTKGGTATTAFTANVVGINVSGAALVQSNTGLGAATGAQIAGRQSAAAFFLPAGSTTASRYTVTATGATITSVKSGASKADAVNANSYTSSTGVTTISPTDFSLGARIAGAATTTGVAVTGSSITDSVIVQFTSATASTAVVTLKSENVTTGALTTVATATVTYGAADLLTLSVANTTIYKAKSTDAPTSSTDSSAIVQSAVVGTQRANILVTVNNGNNTALVDQNVSATISGPGLIAWNSSATGTATSAGTVVYDMGDSENVEYLVVAGSGVGGIATITFAIGTTVLGTETITFYGTAAKYIATTNIVAGASGTASTDAVTVCAVDSAGVAVPSSTIYAFSGDTTVATVEASGATLTSIATASGTDYTNNVMATAPGCYSFDVTAISQKTKSDVVLTFGNAATIATSTFTTTAKVLVGEVATTTVALTSDKASYKPGEAVVLTLAFRDSVGRPVAYGPGTDTLAAALTSSVSLGSSALFGTANISKTGSTVQTVYAPLTAGPVTISGTTGSPAAVTYLVAGAKGGALTATFTVAQNADIAAISLAIDALNAKIVALNALIAKIMKKLGVK